MPALLERTLLAARLKPAIDAHIGLSRGAPVRSSTRSQVNISGSGHTSIEGKDWLTHKHSGVQSGGGASGPVV